MDKVESEDAISVRYSFEEFKLMYESTERVSERKIAFTRANSTFCAAIIAGQSVAASWIYSQKAFLVYGAMGIGLISLLAIAFCIYWTAQINAFKDLNTAKFKVLEYMADKVAFPDYTKDVVISSNPFFKEWEILEANRKLYESGGKRVLRSHFSEMVIPVGFLIFFATFGIFAIFWALTSA